MSASCCVVVDGDTPLAERPVPLENGDATDAVPAHMAHRSVWCLTVDLSKLAGFEGHGLTFLFLVNQPLFQVDLKK